MAPTPDSLLGCGLVFLLLRTTRGFARRRCNSVGSGRGISMRSIWKLGTTYFRSKAVGLPAVRGICTDAEGAEPSDKVDVAGN